MTTDRFTADKATLRAELEHRAWARQVIIYGEAAALVGRAARGLGEILRAIRAEEAARGRPDLGALVVAVSTGLPRGMDRDTATAVQEAVFALWAEAG